MEIYELKNLLYSAWSEETCVNGLRNEWNEYNPSIGQCAITALLVNDYFGGKIMRCMTTTGSHYYNLIDNEIVDLTSEQFLGEVPEYYKSEERTRDYLLSNKDTFYRYMILKNNLNKLIESEKRFRENRINMCIKQRKLN